MHNVENESVYKRNRLMLEHVMLQRAVAKVEGKKDRKNAVKGGKVPSNDWKMRQEFSNEAHQ